MKPIPTDRLIKMLRSCARQMKKPYEERHEDFEEDAVAWAMVEAANRLRKYLNKEKKVTNDHRQRSQQH